MNNLCIPATVASLVRKVVHAVSTLSIAHQYHNFHGTSTKADHVPAILDRDELQPGKSAPVDSEHTPLPTSVLTRWSSLSQVGNWWPQMAPGEQYHQLTRGMCRLYQPRAFF